MAVDYMAPEQPRLARPDATGAFRVAGLQAGRSRVTAICPEDATALFTEAEVEVAANGSASAEVRKRYGTDVMLHVLDDEGLPTGFHPAYLPPGSLPLPTDDDLTRLDSSGWAIEVNGGLEFPSVASGVHTLLVLDCGNGGIRVFRRVLDVQGRMQTIEVRLSKELPVVQRAIVRP
jgi:hypothetical protein